MSRLKFIDFFLYRLDEFRQVIIVLEDFVCAMKLIDTLSEFSCGFLLSAKMSIGLLDVLLELFDGFVMILLHLFLGFLL